MLADIVKEITANAKTQNERAGAIFYFVIDEIRFDVYVDFPDAEKFLIRKAGTCCHYDKEFHNRLIESRLNFDRDRDKTSLNIDFSAEGVKSVQDLYIIEDAGYGEDLTRLKEYMETLPFIKKALMGFAGWLSRKQAMKIRNKVEK